MRLDNYLVEIGLFDSRTKAKQAIERGEIFINGKLCTKASAETQPAVVINRVCEDDFVSLGGFKLKKALIDFDFCVKDLIVADIGASTGGFTDCLMQNGARKIYAVDLRSDLLHSSLLDNDKIKLIVKNAKELTINDFDDKLDLLVADLSFISLSQVINVFSNLLDNGNYAILLIKPQFETGEKRKYKNGIIRDKAVHKSVCENILEQSKLAGFTPLKITEAPRHNDKNLEFLILLKKGVDKNSSKVFFNIN